MSSPDSSSLRVTYDSSDAGMQWRCHLYNMRKPKELIGLGILAVFCASMAPQALIGFLSVVAAFYTLSLFGLATVINKRSSEPRICSTIIDAEGVRDIIPEYDRTYPWQHVRKIEIVECDIYFATITGGLFIPASAFANKQAALDYYKKANVLWQANRDKPVRNQKDLPSSVKKGFESKMEPPKPRVEDLVAEDDSVWVKLEEQHKQSQAKENPKQEEAGDSDK